MENLSQILKQHAKKYKLMQPCDAVKLVYQNEFGGGHFVEDSQKSLQKLIDEYAKTKKDTGLPLFEEIGGGIVRLNLAAVNTDLLPNSVINKVFIASSKSIRGDNERFIKKLDLLYSITSSGIFSFNTDELAEYLYKYKQQGFPAVSHSNEYKNAYNPAYRIIDERYVKLLPVITAIEKSLCEKENVLLGIDGNSSAGKTTTAVLLSKLYDCNIVHTDDFFLPIEMRKKERLNEAGGNIHYERLKSEVLDGLINQKAVEYRIFDCSTGDFSSVEQIKPKKLNIIEGTYSLHPYFGDIYDIKLFLSVSEGEQKSRILKRNGKELYTRFIGEWIPMEEKYFNEYCIRGKCDFVI